MTKRLFTGTTQTAFSLGISGPTIHGGQDAPQNVLGLDGDLYVRVGSAQGLYGRQAGSWKQLREEEAFVHTPVARGEIIAVDPAAKLVTVYRNPYTIDTIDMTIDTLATTIDAQPTNPHTTVELPVGTEGQSLTIKDVSGRYQAFEVRIQGAIDDISQVSIADIGAKLELIFTADSWRVIGR